MGREWKIFSTFPALAPESSEGEHAQTLKAYSISLRDRVHSVLQTGKPRLALPARGQVWSQFPLHHQTLGLRAFKPHCCSLNLFRTEAKNGPTLVSEHKLTEEAATHLVLLCGGGAWLGTPAPYWSGPRGETNRGYAPSPSFPSLLEAEPFSKRS